MRNKTIRFQIHRVANGYVVRMGGYEYDDGMKTSEHIALTKAMAKEVALEQVSIETDKMLEDLE